ncbi:Uncharacterized protein APZ42_010753 [Daphnia magna]|uniref:Uncharacterized protein n=1 Tax=Daphnia magna TaxID=35525 RepID=A0A164D8C0_9CRUS|nr:Uncharacterized protein APZ42_010753 [Daphnia magna]
MAGSRTAGSSAMHQTDRHRKHRLSPTMHPYNSKFHDGYNHLWTSTTVQQFYHWPVRLGTHFFHAMLLGWRYREF